MDTYTTTVVTTNNGPSTTMVVLYTAITILIIVGVWKMFTKAGEAGWKSLIPFYNMYLIFRIAGRNGWWFLALFVPFVNIVVYIMLALDLAKHFGKSNVFGIFGLFLFPYVGYTMLGFGEAKYVGTKHA